VVTVMSLLAAVVAKPGSLPAVDRLRQTGNGVVFTWSARRPPRVRFRVPGGPVVGAPAPVCDRCAVEAIRQFSAEQYGRALEPWHWLDLDGKAALCASPFGDVFLEDDQGVWWLDTLEGVLTRPWATREEFAGALSTTEGQDEYLLAGLGLAAEEAGLGPGPDQVYGFTVPPKLGGALDVDNVEVIDFVVALSLAGQIHRQIRDLPPGTEITGFTLDDAGS